MLKTILQKIGLSDKDSEIYLACLELGTQPASVIAKKAGLKRPTTYLILEGLLSKGLVSEYTGSNVKYFTAVSPEYLLNFIDKQRRELTSHQRELEQFLPQFQSLTNPYSLNPKVRFYEGIEGVERAMNDTLTSTEPLRCYSTMDAWFARPDTKEFILRYGKQRVYEKKIPLRSINPDTPLARKYLEEDYPEVNVNPAMSHFRWLPKEIQLFSNEINIYDNKMAIACLGKNELLGIIIESESIASTQKSIFEAAWMAAVPNKWELKKK
jgi:sugar-specific transcriptional regulator TrmB